MQTFNIFKSIMKKFFICLVVSLLATVVPVSTFAQKKHSSISQITSSDLESYVSFLASPLLKGRMNGEEGLEIAAQYIASQARLSGIKPANANSYFQPYTVLRKLMDKDKTMVQIISGNKDTVTIQDPVSQLIPTGPSDFILDGEVVFAGYGIKADKYKYNDFENLKTEGKILLVMSRSPMSGDGKRSRFEEPVWNTGMTLMQLKLSTLFMTKAKAILFVSDPKSGFKSLEESNPDFAGYIKTSVTLKGEEEEKINPFMAAMPKIILDL
jgi:hypothetical protein